MDVPDMNVTIVTSTPPDDTIEVERSDATDESTLRITGTSGMETPDMNATNSPPDEPAEIERSDVPNESTFSPPTHWESRRLRERRTLRISETSGIKTPNTNATSTPSNSPVATKRSDVTNESTLLPKLWGSSRLRERRTLRITERLTKKKNASGESKLSATKGAECADAGNTTAIGLRRGRSRNLQADDKNATIVKRGRGRPRKRPSDVVDQVDNIVRKRKYSIKEDGNKKVSESVDPKIAEAERNDSKIPEAERSDSKITEAEKNYSKITEVVRDDSKIPEAERNDSKISEAESNDSKITEAVIDDSKITEAERNDSKIPESEGNDSTNKSLWHSRLRGRRAKRKLSEEDLDYSDPEDPPEDTEVDKIVLPNVNFEHIKILENETKYQCTICMKKFRNESSKTIHVSCKLNEKFFTCEYCRQKDLTKADYESHLEKHTGNHHFVCHFCGEWFLKRRKWIFHILLHEGRSHFFCKPCKKRFPYFRRKLHIRLHNGDQPFSCQRCKEQFIVNVNEQEICDEEKQPAGICASCGEKFKTKFKYYGHVLTESRCHYSCDECAAHFSRKKAPFKCRACKAEFTRRSILESHKKCIHPSPPKKAQDKQARSPRKAKPIENIKSPGPDEEPELTHENPTVIITTPTRARSEGVTEEGSQSLPVVQELEEPVREPIEPLSSIKIKTSSGSIFVFERVASTQEKWQQTNMNNTERTLDNDFCSQCHYSFNESSSYSVNSLCGHLLCEPCFLDDNEGCLLCMGETNHSELQNLDQEDKDSLDSAIEILKKLAAKRVKDDTPDISINENESINSEGVKYPIVLSCIRGAVEKSVSEKSIQFP